MSQPLVSMLMMTYGRLREGVDHTCLISEAVHSFLQQDYPNKELILLNDTPGQTIVFNHPLVKVVNSNWRFPTLGDKRNATVDLAQGEYLFVFDDDDIMLPWRLSQGVQHFLDTGCDYSGAGTHFLSCQNQNYSFHATGENGLMASACFRRSVFDHCKYWSGDSGEDQQLVKDVRAAGLKVESVVAPRLRTSMIYRWNYLTRNISSMADAVGYKVLGRGTFPKAKIRLFPSWKYNYVQRIRDLVAAEMV